MTNTKPPTRSAIIPMVVLSLVVHIIGALAVYHTIDFDLEPVPAQPPKKKLDVRAVSQEQFDKLLRNRKRARKPERPPKEKEKEKPKEEIKPVESRKPVEQVTNEQRPTLAKYISNEDNKVEEETRARETVRDSTPSNEPEKGRPKPTHEPAQEQKKERTKAGEKSPKRTAKTDGLIQKRSEPKPETQKEQGNPFALPTVADARRVLDDPGDSDHHKKFHTGRKLFENYEQREAAYRASLENFIQEVKPGNHTGVNAHKNVVARYLYQIHSKIHPQWGEGYLIELDLREPRGSELQDPKLNTKLEFVINSKDGSLDAVNIVKSSGAFRFDAEAVNVSLAAGPHPRPPPEVVSPNGKVYVHWNFWRDGRQCGPFGANIFLVDKDS